MTTRRMFAQWRLIAGAGRCAAAWLGWDRAPEEAQLARLGSCRACPAVTVRRVRGGIALFCGPALVEQDAADDGGGPTCGCLVGYVPRDAVRLVDEEAQDERRRSALALALPACKTCVGSATCPRGRWRRDATLDA